MPDTSEANNDDDDDDENIDDDDDDDEDVDAVIPTSATSATVKASCNNSSAQP